MELRGEASASQAPDRSVEGKRHFFNLLRSLNNFVATSTKSENCLLYYFSFADWFVEFCLRFRAVVCSFVRSFRSRYTYLCFQEGGSEPDDPAGALGSVGGVAKALQIVNLAFLLFHGGSL